MKKLHYLAAVSLTVLISAQIFTGCSTDKTAESSVSDAEATGVETTETEASEENSSEYHLDPIPMLDSLTFDNPVSADTPDKFTTGICMEDDFVASSDYGYIYPYCTERVFPELSETRSEGRGRGYGFCTGDGTILCGPIFDEVYTVTDCEYDDFSDTLYYEVTRYGQKGYINYTGTYYSGCIYSWGMRMFNGDPYMVQMVRYEGDEAIISAYNFREEKQICTDMRVPRAWVPNYDDPVDPSMQYYHSYWVSYVIDDEHLIVTDGCNSFFCNATTKKTIPEFRKVEDDMSDGVRELFAIYFQAIPINGDRIIIREFEDCYMIDYDGNVLTPHFEATLNGEYNDTDYKLSDYAYFFEKGSDDHIRIYDTNGEFVKTIPAIKDGYIVKEGGYYWIAEYMDMGCFDMNFDVVKANPNDFMRSRMEFGDYMYREVYGSDIDTFNNYCGYLGRAARKSRKEQYIEVFGAIGADHTYISKTHDSWNEEIIYRFDGLTNDSFFDPVTGKHYLTFAVGKDDVTGRELTYMDDTRMRPDNVIFCLEDGKAVNLDVGKGFTEVIAIVDSHMILNSNLGRTYNYPFPKDEKAYQEIYDISDLDNPVLTFHYTMQDAES